MDHLPEEISRELERVVRRWRELPADRALAASADVRALVRDLAEQTLDSARAAQTVDGGRAAQTVDDGRAAQTVEPGHDRPRTVGAPATVPDLGPAVLIDQLRVLVWDAATTGVPDLHASLSALRRSLP